MLQTLIRILLPTLCFSATASFAETFCHEKTLPYNSLIVRMLI